jgi:hypothetical protein
MKFTLEVGEMEKHVVDFNFNQLRGSLVIRVDDKPIFKSTRVFNEPVHAVYNFMIEGREMSAVRIEQRRKQLFGHHDTVYVNDHLAQVIDRFF